MQFIQDPTAVSDRPPAPSPLTGFSGWFAPAVPGIRVATRLRYWWMNMIMAELCNFCAMAGISPDGTSEHQLTYAVRNMIFQAGRKGMMLWSTTAAGPFSFTVPDDVTGLEIEMWGGGSGSWASTTSIPGGGGSSGGYVRLYAEVAPGDVISGIAGNGGFAGTTGPTAPTAGGNTTVNGVIGGTITAGGGTNNPLNSTGAPSFGNIRGMGTIVGGAPQFQILFEGGDGTTGSGVQGGMGAAAPKGGGTRNSGTYGLPGCFPGGGASGAGCPSGVHYDAAAGANGLVLIRFF